MPQPLLSPFLKTFLDLSKNEEEKPFDLRLAEISQFIDKLSHLDDLDKYWARDKDAPELLKDGVSLKKLKEKYEFYDRLAELQTQILQNVPKNKQEVIRNIIRRVTSKPTHGTEREMKLEHVLCIKRTVEAFHQNQISLHFLVKRHTTSGDVHFGVAQILNEEIFEEFREIFPDRFWRLTDEMTPVDFPNFTTAFNFALKETFVESQAIESLKKWPEKLKSSALFDAEEILSEFFPEETKSAILSKIKQIPAQKPEKILAELLILRKQKEKQKKLAQRDLIQVKSFFTDKNPKASLAFIQDMRKKYGNNIQFDLNERQLFLKIEKNVSEIERLEAEIRKEKNPHKKEKLAHELTFFQEITISNIDMKNITFEVRQKKKEEILEQINQHRKHGDLKSAENSARALHPFDASRSLQELKEIQAEKLSTENQEENPQEKTSETSEVKKLKIEFLEKCIEHAEKVVEICGQVGIPSDDPKYWGVEGVRNRASWLRKNGLWDTYKRFNDSDKNMPNRTQTGGFRFRWLDLRTGSNLTTSNAESGIRYLKRYKESGYPVAALGGAFSVDWKGSSSPVYPPRKFISLVQAELNRIRGGK